MTEQDKADLLLLAETICWESPPYPAEAEAAYQRVRGRLNIEKAVQTYREAIKRGFMRGDTGLGLLFNPPPSSR